MRLIQELLSIFNFSGGGEFLRKRGDRLQNREPIFTRLSLAPLFHIVPQYVESVRIKRGHFNRASQNFLLHEPANTLERSWQCISGRLTVARFNGFKFFPGKSRCLAALSKDEY